VSSHVIAARRDGVPEVMVVWGAVLPDDDRAAAGAAAASLDAPGVRQYWDADMALGRLLGEHLGVDPQPFAWDVYLYYEWDATFEEGPPTPMAWAHQMGGAVPQRLHVLGDLDAFLRETTAGLPLVSAGDR
jgi:hypothetical protein